MSIVRATALSLSVIALVAQADTRVSSVTARIVRKPVSLQYVIVENLRSAPMLEWTVGLGSTTRFERALDPPSVPGPIAPGSTRRVRFIADATSPTSARLVRAVFADGFVESGGTAQQTVKLRTESALGNQLVLRLENLRDLPLEAWEYEVPDPNGRSSTGNREDAGFSPRDSSLIGAHQVREINLRSGEDVADADITTPAILFAMWRDLSWEGRKASRDELLAERDQRANEYAFWISTIKDANAMTPEAAIAFVERKRDERKRAVPAESDFLVGTIPDWATRSKKDPAMTLRTLQFSRTILEQQYALLTRHHPAR